MTCSLCSCANVQITSSSSQACHVFESRVCVVVVLYALFFPDLRYPAAIVRGVQLADVSEVR